MYVILTNLVELNFRFERIIISKSIDYRSFIWIFEEFPIFLSLLHHIVDLNVCSAINFVHNKDRENVECANNDLTRLNLDFKYTIKRRRKHIH